MKPDTRVRLSAAEVACVGDGCYLVSEPGRVAGVVVTVTDGVTGPDWAARLVLRALAAPAEADVLEVIPFTLDSEDDP